MFMLVTKKDLIMLVSKKLGKPQNEVLEMFDVLFETIKENLDNGYTVGCRPCFKFYPAKYKSVVKYNPFKKGIVTLQERMVYKCRLGSFFKR